MKRKLPIFDLSQGDVRGGRAPGAREPQLRLAASADTAELLIYGEIGSWWGDGPETMQVIKDLAAMDVSNINVRINSPGGLVFDGIAIYNALVQHKANVTVDIEGVAASIASVIAMAGDKIRISEAASLMIHKPWSFVVGDASAMRKEADVLDTLEGGLVDIYRARTDMAASDIQDMLAAETWMRGQEAVDKGFADEMMSAKKKPCNAWRSPVYALFRNAPADLLAPAREDAPAPTMREFERMLRSQFNLSADNAKAVASLAARQFAAERDVPAEPHRDDAPTPAADDVGAYYKVANHLRKLTTSI